MSEAKNDKNVWRTAKDPKSGREYYYNAVTKETTWNKPDALLSETELAEVRLKREEARNFFDEMERNILHKIRHGDLPEKTNDESKDLGPRRDSEDGFTSGRPRRSSVGGFRLVRTISTIDDELLEMIKHGVSYSVEEESKYMPDPFSDMNRRQRADSLQRGDSGFKDEKGVRSPVRALSPEEAKSPADATIKKPQRRRRNSTGTIYVDTTMSKQDDEHTIECIAVVIRAHMEDAIKQNVAPRKEYEAFNDTNNDHRKAEAKGSSSKLKIPSVATISEFFKGVFEKCQLEHECIIITLIYIERLIKVTKGRLTIKHDNWRSILFACMIMASKVWDDLSMWNVDFSQVSTEFDLHRINELELALLSALEYSVKVPASEYAKYYFHLRSMMARLGFHANLNSMLRPLDIKGAKKLELATELYENSTQMESTRRRGASVIAGPGCVIPSGKISRMRSAPLEERMGGDDIPSHDSVGLEQLVHGVHLNADGSVPTAKKSGTPLKKEESKL